MRLHDVELHQRRLELEGVRSMLNGLATLAKVFIALWVIVMLIGAFAGPGLRKQERRGDDARPAKHHRVHGSERAR